MSTIIVNGQNVEIGDAERLNGIQVAARAGYDVPRYCWHPGLSVVASCRMCLVETGTKNFETGQVQMLPKLVPACQTPAKHGTVFNTESDAVKKARSMAKRSAAPTSSRFIAAAATLATRSSCSSIAA
jgi:NADH-quinone oxidoreductase subunit G